MLNCNTNILGIAYNVHIRRTIYTVRTLYGVQCSAIWSTMFGHIPYTAGIQYAAHIVQLVWMYVYVQCTTYTCH